MTSSESFKSLVEDYLIKTGMTATAFGRTVLKDPNFVFQLRAGRLPKLGIVDKVEKYISDNRPRRRRSA